MTRTPSWILCVGVKTVPPTIAFTGFGSPPCERTHRAAASERRFRNSNREGRIAVEPRATSVGMGFASPHGTLTAGTSPNRPKYGLFGHFRDSYAPPSSGPHSTPCHPTVADWPQKVRTTRQSMATMAVSELGPMLTASEVAEMLHLHVNTVKRLGDRGELPFYRVCKRGDRRFRLDDVMAFLARNR